MANKSKPLELYMDVQEYDLQESLEILINKIQSNYDVPKHQAKKNISFCNN